MMHYREDNVQNGNHPQFRSSFLARRVASVIDVVSRLSSTGMMSILDIMSAKT